MSDEISLHLSAEEIAKLAHYGHFIPVGKGFTRRYVEDNFPGWEWNDIIPVLILNGVLSTAEREAYLPVGPSLYIDEKVKGVTIHRNSKIIEVEN